MKNRIVSDSMYTDNDHYLKFCILRSIVLTIQNVCRLNFLQVPHYYIVKNHCLAFKRTFVCVYDKPPT